MGFKTPFVRRTNHTFHKRQRVEYKNILIFTGNLSQPA